eukprot:2032355-Rhodomonas_salina.1
MDEEPKEPLVQYEDESFLVVWKPSWATLHGIQGDAQSSKQSVEQWATARLAEAGCIPRVVLDPEMPRQKEQRGCSGLILICKDKSAAQVPLTKRIYTALVAGPVHTSEEKEDVAITVLDRTPSYECGELCLVTVQDVEGRCGEDKRQVRRAMQARNHPVVGKPSMGKCRYGTALLRTESA